MRSVLIALIVALCVACVFAAEVKLRLEAVPSAQESVALFQKFKVDFSRSYASAEEEAAKLATFQENLKEIVEMNLKSKKATFAINKFADWTKAERKRLSGTIPPPHIQELQKTGWNNTIVPQIVANDWRGAGVITDVKDQAQCGSCWAFAATECVESAWALAGQGLNTLSPQDCLDCSGAGSCNGGNPEGAINWARNGQDFDWSYPYTASDQDCQHNGNIGAYGNGDESVPGSENDLYNYLQNMPVGVAIDATNIGFFDSGYMDSSNCGMSSIDHAVQVVGTAVSYDGTPLWIVRNSWGGGWADNGYFYIAMNEGACLIGQWSYVAH